MHAACGMSRAWITFSPHAHGASDPEVSVPIKSMGRQRQKQGRIEFAHTAFMRLAVMVQEAACFSFHLNSVCGGKSKRRVLVDQIGSSQGKSGKQKERREEPTFADAKPTLLQLSASLMRN